MDVYVFGIFSTVFFVLFFSRCSLHTLLQTKVYNTMHGLTECFYSSCLVSSSKCELLVLHDVSLITAYAVQSKRHVSSLNVHERMCQLVICNHRQRSRAALL